MMTTTMSGMENYTYGVRALSFFYVVRIRTCTLGRNAKYQVGCIYCDSAEKWLHVYLIHPAKCYLSQITYLGSTPACAEKGREMLRWGGECGLFCGVQIFQIR